MNDFGNKGVGRGERCPLPAIGDYVKLDGRVYCIEHLFMDEYYINVRNMVRSTPAKMTGRESMYLGYIYKTNDGKYEKYYISGGINNVARFICSSEDNKMLCNSDDYPLLCSIGDYLDLIRSGEEVKKLLVMELKKYQDGEERPDFERRYE